MSEPINLNKVRKARARAEAKAQADANAAKHGRTKSERMSEAARAEKLRRAIEGHKRDDKKGG
ncbi:MAG: DUF4169 family protein [Pseudomonadota bacterium]